MGPSDETLVDELRVVGAVASPPEVGPGEAVTLDVTIVDPEAEGVDLLVWACTPTGDGCVEDALPLVDRLAAPEVEDGQGQAILTVPGGPLPADVSIPSAVWLLACEPGLCPIIELAAQALESGSELPDALRDPIGLLQDLPLQGVSLASRTVVVSGRPVEERNTNPTVTLTSGVPLEIPAEGTLDLPLEIADSTAPDGLDAVGLATAGGFSAPLFDILDGRADLVFFAPEGEGEVELYVVVEDGLGGSALWRGTATVQESENSEPTED